MVIAGRERRCLRGPPRYPFAPFVSREPMQSIGGPARGAMPDGQGSA